MRLYLKSKRKNINAIAEYNEDTKSVTVLKGSKISESVLYSETFRGAKTIELSRQGIVNNGIVTHDITFKSASTAANFVTGVSTNGLTAWKNEDGVPLKSIISELEVHNENR